MPRPKFSHIITGTHRDPGLYIKTFIAKRCREIMARLLLSQHLSSKHMNIALNTSNPITAVRLIFAKRSCSMMKKNFPAGVLGG